MARPQSKDELLDAARDQYARLLAVIAAMSEDEQAAPLDYGPDFKGKEAHWERDKNLRDVLAHLHEWQKMLLDWVGAHRAGDDDASFLPAPHNWRTTAALNGELQAKHQGTSLEQATQLLDQSHDQVIAVIEGYTDEELFTKAHFPWTGTSSLGSYCVSATSSHYDWALKKLRAAARARKAAL